MAIIASKQRPVSFVKQDFAEKGLAVGWLTRRRLAFFPEQAYSEVLSLAGRVADRIMVERIKVDPYEKVSGVRFSDIPEPVIEKECVRGKRAELLDLRGIEVALSMLNAAKAEQASFSESNGGDKVRGLLDIILGERVFFDRIVRDPNATAEKLYKSLAHGVEKFKQLGFHATIFRPDARTANAGWSEFYRAEKWGSGSYAEPSVPKDTLMSVLLSSEKSFSVNLDNEYSFSIEGLSYNREKLEYDREHSKGSPEMLIYKLEGEDGIPLAVVYINNRVGRGSPKEPSRELFAKEDAGLIREELSLYFNEAARALNTVMKRNLPPEPEISREKKVLAPSEKGALLRLGQPLVIGGQRVRLFEVPSEKFFRQIPEVVDWLRETILSVYDGTEIAKGKSREELIKELSLEDDKMLERLIYSRYLALIEGGPKQRHLLKGVVSGTVIDVNHDPGVVFKVPEAMIKRDARGKKLQVALSYEMMMRVVRKRWAEMGFIKGFFYMLNKGVPFYATTQSLRVARDMMRLDDLSIVRLARGEELSETQKKVIKLGSSGKADDRGIERDAYGGRVAIDEEEKGISVREPHFFFTLPGIRSIFRRHIIRTRREDKRIKRMFKEELRHNGRFHIVGSVTLGTALKVWLELKLASLFSKKN